MLCYIAAKPGQYVKKRSKDWKRGAPENGKREEKVERREGEKEGVRQKVSVKGGGKEQRERKWAGETKSRTSAESF